MSVEQIENPVTAGNIFVNAESLAHESGIEWLRDPATVPYVRETVVLCSRRAGRMRDQSDSHEKFAEMVGYAVLSSEARARDGFFRRRLFWLKTTDRTCDPDGRYIKDAPVEAVDPLTVKPGIPGRKTPRVFGRE